MGYYKQALSGISWMGALRAVTRGLAFVKIAILARIFSPAQFGIYGIASLVLGFLEMLTETGINIFLIQKQEKVDKYIDSAWVVSIVRGIIISLIIFLAAPIIANYFDNSGSTLIIRLISLVPLIRGFINPSCVKYQKNLEFKKQFFYDSSLFIVDFVIAIALGLITKSENSLVFAMIGSTLLEVVLSFIFFDPKPKFIFDKEKTMEVINRGKWITGAGIFNYLFQNLDDIVVGKMMGAGNLGVYQLSYKVSTLPVSEVGEVFNKVTFPIYSTMKDDPKRIKKTFLKTLLVICLFVIPFGLTVFYFPTQIVNILLGEKWLVAVPVLQILAIFGVLKAITNSFFSLFLGIDRQEVVTLITLFSTLVLAGLLYPLIKIFGLFGAGYATIIATVASIPLFIYFFFKYFK